MSFQTGSNAAPFGVRRRLHPAVALGAATAGSLAVIVGGSIFLGQAVAEAAASVPPPRTERTTWYAPPAKAVVTGATVLDIARSVPVKVSIPEPTAAGAIFSYKIGVESLKVRAGPAKTTSQVFVLKGGTPVTAGQTKNGWIEITTQDGRSGWVFAKFLNPAKG